MKKLTTILFLAVTSFSMAQDWFSISTPWSELHDILNISIDNSSNTITYNTLRRIHILKGDGTNFTIGALPYSGDYNFGDGGHYVQKAYYYNDRVYVVSDNVGLRRLTFEPQYKDTILYYPGLNHALIDFDTLWMSGNDPSDGVKFVNEANNSNFINGFNDLIKYKGNVYARVNLSAGVQYGLAQYGEASWVFHSESNSNILSDSIGGFCTNDENGILFVGTAQGLSQFNGATFTNITPATHPEMPYKAVLDVEYDHRNGKLWMVLGDDNLTAKTLTSYDGSWETFDASNSPVDFNKFVDMVVDTLGQVWIAEEQELHVLNTNQLEGWLATEKHKKQNFDVSVYPNPSNGIINLKIAADEMVQLRIFNSKGQEVYHQNKASGIIELDLPEGIYHYTVTNDTQEINTGKFIRL